MPVPASPRQRFPSRLARSLAGAILALLIASTHAGDSPQVAVSRALLAAPDSRNFPQQLAAAALDRTHHSVRYVPSYVSIPYPGGDVPADTGVCTDVVVRAYRALGHDLQKLVHEDMQDHFSRYPKIWGLKKADPNIDHRRVPNLQTFFTRHGKKLPTTKKPEDYSPGDLVAWDLNDKGLVHIGILVPAPDGTEHPWVVHNMGRGPVLEDILFAFTIIGHYRFSPKPSAP